jgi:hypothetical protein
MRLLPAQTHRTCQHNRANPATRCTFRAELRETFRTLANGEVRTRDTRDVCHMHHEPEHREFNGQHSGAHIVMSCTAVPLPKLCTVCGNDCDERGRCTHYQWAVWRWNCNIRCDCAVCVEYGGDCAWSASLDSAHDIIKEHRPHYFTLNLKMRTPIRPLP